MLDVHPFFAKQYGCDIVEHSVPIDIDPFAEAVRDRRPHPRLFLGFWERIGIPGRNALGLTPIQSAEVGGLSAYAHWFYDLGTFALNVIYGDPGESTRGMVKAYHPTRRTKFLRIKGR